MDLASRLETAAWHLDQAMKPAMAETVREAIAALQPGGEPVGWVVELRGRFLRYQQTLPDPFPDKDFSMYPVYRTPAPVAVTVDDEFRQAAMGLFEAVRRFRNEPHLERLHGLRKTKGYSDLCMYWKDMDDTISAAAPQRSAAPRAFASSTDS